jgi:hypothetical protein
MPRTPQEQRNWERACYGYLESDMREAFCDALKRDRPQAIVTSLLSDVQEILSMYGLKREDQVRQMLNRAKWFIREYLTEKPQSPCDGEVMGVGPNGEVLTHNGQTGQVEDSGDRV